MDTVLYKQLLAIVATIEKLQKDFKNSTVSVTNLEENIKKTDTENKKNTKNLQETQKKELETFKKDINKEIEKNIANLTKQISNLDIKLGKIDIKSELLKELQNYTKNDALESVLNDLKKSINDITLKHGKDGKNGINGLNRTRW